MPYRDGGEFANVGILLHCAAIGYLKLKSGGQQIISRVRGFFPKIEEAVFRKGLDYMKKSINSESANTSMDFNVLAHSTEGMFFSATSVSSTTNRIPMPYWKICSTATYSPIT